VSAFAKTAVILDKEAVIGRPHAAQTDAVSVGRTVDIAERKSVKLWKLIWPRRLLFE